MSVTPETLLRVELTCPGEHPDDPVTLSALLRTPLAPESLPPCPSCGLEVLLWTSTTDDEPAPAENTSAAGS